jgi:hypothetical protein
MRRLVAKVLGVYALIAVWMPSFHIIRSAQKQLDDPLITGVEHALWWLGGAIGVALGLGGTWLLSKIPNDVFAPEES